MRGTSFLPVGFLKRINIVLIPQPEPGHFIDILHKEYPAIFDTMEDVRDSRDVVKILHRDAKNRVLGSFRF